MPEHPEAAVRAGRQVDASLVIAGVRVDLELGHLVECAPVPVVVVVVPALAAGAEQAVRGCRAHSIVFVGVAVAVVVPAIAGFRPARVAVPVQWLAVGPVRCAVPVVVCVGTVQEAVLVAVLVQASRTVGIEHACEDADVFPVLTVAFPGHHEPVVGEYGHVRHGLASLAVGDVDVALELVAVGRAARLEQAGVHVVPGGDGVSGPGHHEAVVRQAADPGIRLEPCRELVYQELSARGRGGGVVDSCVDVVVAAVLTVALPGHHETPAGQRGHGRGHLVARGPGVDLELGLGGPDGAAEAAEYVVTAPSGLFGAFPHHHVVSVFQTCNVGVRLGAGGPGVDPEFLRVRGAIALEPLAVDAGTAAVLPVAFPDHHVAAVAQAGHCRRVLEPGGLGVDLEVGGHGTVRLEAPAVDLGHVVAVQVLAPHHHQAVVGQGGQGRLVLSARGLLVDPVLAAVRGAVGQVSLGEHIVIVHLAAAVPDHHVPTVREGGHAGMALPGRGPGVDLELSDVVVGAPVPVLGVVVPALPASPGQAQVGRRAQGPALVRDPVAVVVQAVAGCLFAVLVGHVVAGVVQAGAGVPGPTGAQGGRLGGARADPLLVLAVLRIVGGEVRIGRVGVPVAIVVGSVAGLRVGVRVEGVLASRRGITGVQGAGVRVVAHDGVVRAPRRGITGVRGAHAVGIAIGLGLCRAGTARAGGRAVVDQAVTVGRCALDGVVCVRAARRGVARVVGAVVRIVAVDGRSGLAAHQVVTSLDAVARVVVVARERRPIHASGVGIAGLGPVAGVTVVAHQCGSAGTARRPVAPFVSVADVGVGAQGIAAVVGHSVAVVVRAVADLVAAASGHGVAFQA